MSRKISIIGLTTFLFNISCAHECRYCLYGEKRPTKVPFSRFARLVERMAEWTRASQNHEFSFGFLAGYARNAEVEKLREHNDLSIQIGHGPRYEGLPLGGLRFRPAGERSTWLSSLRNIGVKTLHASLAGYGAVHDHWNGRKGDFDYLMDLMRRGAVLGMHSEQTLFVLKSTLPLIEDLREMMDFEFGDRAKYAVRTFNYTGRSKAFEHERITEDMRDAMPTWAKASLGDRFNLWRSEREWIDFIMQAHEEVERVELNLEVNETNIERLEAMSARAIFEELESEANRTYEAIPSLKDLCASVGDPTNVRIYQESTYIDALWQDRAAVMNLKPLPDLGREIHNVHFNNFIFPEP